MMMKRNVHPQCALTLTPETGIMSYFSNNHKFLGGIGPSEYYNT